MSTQKEKPEVDFKEVQELQKNRNRNAADPQNNAGKHTFKTVPFGDGSLYGWNEYDEKGNVVRSSDQQWPSEADAEKSMRATATTADIVEVQNVKNINPEANRNVNLVKPSADVVNENAGMNVVPESIEKKKEDEVSPRPPKRKSQSKTGSTAPKKPARKAKK